MISPETLTVIKDYVWIPVISLAAFIIPMWWKARQDSKGRSLDAVNKKEAHIRDTIVKLREDLIKLEEQTSALSVQGVTTSEVKGIVTEKLEFVVLSLREVSRMLEAANTNQIKLRESYARQDERLSMAEREIERFKDGR
jgi:hypothetical protein